MSNADETLSGFSSPFGHGRERTTAPPRDFRGPTGPARAQPAGHRATATEPTSPRSSSRLRDWVNNYGGGSPRSQPTNGKRQRDASGGPTPAQRSAPVASPRSQHGSPVNRNLSARDPILHANSQPAPAPRAAAPATATSPLRPRPATRPTHELPVDTPPVRVGSTALPANGSGRQSRPTTTPSPRDATPPDGPRTSRWKAPFPQRVSGTPIEPHHHLPLFAESQRQRSPPTTVPSQPSSRPPSRSPRTPSSHKTDTSSPAPRHHLNRRPPPPPSTHNSTDLESDAGGSIKSVQSWARSTSSLVSDDSDSDFKEHESDYDSDPPRPKPFNHGPWSLRAAHPDSVADDTPVGKKQTKEEKKTKAEEKAAREARKRAKLFAREDVLHRTFQDPKHWSLGEPEKQRRQPGKRSNPLGLGVNKYQHVVASGAAAKPPNGATKSPDGPAGAAPTKLPVPVVQSVEPLKSPSGWKERREAAAKKEADEDHAEFKKRLDAMTRKREAKQREKYNIRMENRRYDAFMNEPLSRYHQYPDQYQALDDLREEPQVDYGWDDPDPYALNPWPAPRPYTTPRQPLRNLREEAALELEKLLDPYHRPPLPRRTPGSRWRGLPQDPLLIPEIPFGIFGTRFVPDGLDGF